MTNLTPEFHGSRRHRLWELSTASHCPVIGVCLPLAILRRLARRLPATQASLDDFELHSGMVGHCATRNPVSLQLQRELDDRHAAAIRQFRDCREADAVLARWREAVDAGTVAGALWASLTHPRCDERVHEKICHDIHMIQHQAGAAVRADSARLQALERERDELHDRHEALRARHARTLEDHAREESRFRAAMIESRTKLVLRESELVFLRDDLQSLRAAMPDLDTRQRLSARLGEAKARLREQDKVVAALRAEVDLLAQRLATHASAAPHDSGEPCATGDEPAPHLVGITGATADALRDRTVLCVGGRPGQVPHYREIIERLGAHYLHHDGGVETSLARLESSIAAADLVICQTGCISHNAYWRVKDTCKRSGKQCVFVENPSPSTLTRSLSAALGPIPMWEDASLSGR